MTICWPQFSPQFFSQLSLSIQRSSDAWSPSVVRWRITAAVTLLEACVLVPRCAAVLIRSNSVSSPAASLSTRQVSDLRLRNEFSGLCFLIHYNPVITSPVYKPSLYNPTVPATVRVPHPKPDTPAPFKRSFLGIVYLQRRAAKRTNIGKGQQFLSFVLSTARFQACRITLPLFPPLPH